MKRKNYRSTTGQTLDLKRRKRVTFVGVDDRTPSFNDSPEAREGRSVDAKTSEYAFFKKLKSNASHRFGSKLSNNVEEGSKMSESNIKTRGPNDRVKDGDRGFSFSTPVETARHDKGSKQSSPEFRAMCGGDKNVAPQVNNTRSGGVTNHTGDMFSMKRKRIHQWVKNTGFIDITEFSSSRCDLVPVLLTRMFPEAGDKQVSNILAEDRIDRVKNPKFIDSPGSNFLNVFNESYGKVEQKPHMENGRSIFHLDWPGERIVPTLQFPTAHCHSSFIPRDPEESNFAISYSKGDSFYRPPFLKQKSLALCSDEGNLRCYHPTSSPWFRNCKPLSPIHHGGKDGYMPERLTNELKEPTLLLEWDTVSRENTDYLPLSYHKKLITYPIVSASYGYNHPWDLDDASDNLGSKELCSLPLISSDSPGSIPFPFTNSISHFEDGPGTNISGDQNAVSCYTFLQLPYSPVEHDPSPYQTIEAPGYEIRCLPFSSDAYLLEAFRRTDYFRSRDWSPLE